MIFNVIVKNEEEKKEAIFIIQAEAKNHFEHELEIRESMVFGNQPVLIFEVKNYEYFNDIEKMKNDCQATGYSIDYFTDFISEVEDNLSFVAKIKVVA